MYALRIIIILHLHSTILALTLLDNNVHAPLGKIGSTIKGIIQEDPFFVDANKMDFNYWNSHLGNENPIKINVGDESNILDYWDNDLSLKVITHGWLGSDKDYTGVFVIKTAYVDIGGFNVISVDWSEIAKNIVYPIPAAMTKSVGYVISEFLDRLVDLTGINPSNIHLIGHSLGAHVVGSCGFHFKSGKIGRITGLDPAAPGFEIIPLTTEKLSKENAEFVDVIHTAAGSLGYFQSLGHVDFFPNSGTAPQPGCEETLTDKLLILPWCSHFRSIDFYAESVYNKTALIAVNCPSWYDFISSKCLNNVENLIGDGATPSHSRSYELYADSVYNKTALVAVKCPSWYDFIFNKCKNNIENLIGDGATPSVTGNFFTKTTGFSPFTTF